jgi:phosphatidate cytidylyltransferase
MLRQRVLSALVLLPIVLAATVAGGWWFFGMVLTVTLLAGYEYYALLAGHGYHPAPSLGIATIGGLLVAAKSDVGQLGRAVLAAAAIASLLWQIYRSPLRRSLTDWALTLAGAVYIGWLAGFLISVRDMSSGLGWTWVILLGSWVNDSAAYLTGVYLAGRYLPRHAFAPTVSPKKTWEGSVAGWLACTILTALLAQFLGTPLLLGILLGALIGVLGTMGDLAVSVLKRQVGAKDSGALIPGHGGMLDRVDGLLFVSAVVYYFVVWIVRAT